MDSKELFFRNHVAKPDSRHVDAAPTATVKDKNYRQFPLFDFGLLDDESAFATIHTDPMFCLHIKGIL